MIIHVPFASFQELGYATKGGTLYTALRPDADAAHRHLCGSRSVRQDEARLCAASCSGAHLAAAASLYAEADAPCAPQR